MKALLLCGAALALAAAPAPGRDADRPPLLTASQVGARHLPDLGFARRAARRTFFVDPAGSDANPGTAAKPWQTLGQAARALQPGEQALVRAGTYREQIVTGHAGRADAPIRLAVAAGAAGKVRMAGAVPGKPFIRITKPYWIVEGFEIDAEGKHDAAKDAWQPAIAFDRADHALVRAIHAQHGSGPSIFSVSASRDVAASPSSSTGTPTAS